MHIEIVSIGDELLSGMVVNINAAFMSKALFEEGYEVSRQSVFADDPLILDKELRSALSRSSVIIATGGLGSTFDDHTRKIAACLFDSECVYHEKVAQDLKSRFGEKLLSLKDQATIPEKATPLLNSIGTAPGLIFTSDKKMLILLPGVPLEMQTMFMEKVLPFLKEKMPVTKKHFAQLHLCLITESAIDPFLRQLKKQYPDVHAGIYPFYGTVSLALRSTSKDQLKAFVEALTSRYASSVFSQKSPNIQEAIQEWFIRHRKFLALAESCTGGAISSQLVSVSGASEYLLGSFVTYSDIFKIRTLGVSENTLKTQGAVSEACVKEMLEGLFRNPEVDFAIAVSGIAGPLGGSPEKPVGTILAAIGEKGKPPDCGQFTITGSRTKIIQTTTNYLLGALWRKITQGVPAFP